MEPEHLSPELIRLLEESEEEVPSHIRDAARLSDFAVTARYPGVMEPVSPAEYQGTLALAKEVVRWVEANL